MKTPSLKDIRKEFKWKLQKGVWAGYLSDWKGGSHRYGYKLDFDVYLPTKGKNLQRPFCWTLAQKRELILSMIKGIDIQAFSIIISTDEDKTRTY